jgi:hypothetical protein
MAEKRCPWPSNGIRPGRLANFFLSRVRVEFVRIRQPYIRRLCGLIIGKRIVLPQPPLSLGFRAWHEYY